MRGDTPLICLHCNAPAITIDGGMPGYEQPNPHSIGEIRDIPERHPEGWIVPLCYPEERKTGIDQEERRMFRFGKHTFTIGQWVKWKAGKKFHEGMILSEPFNEGQWIEIRTE